MVATPFDQPLSVSPGDLLENRYVVRELIAVGGMGSIFLAEHVRIKRRLAVKVLHPELARDTANVTRFMNEALAAGTLGHPNIVEATDMGFAREHVPYIVFEYLEGVLLTEEIYRVGGMAPRRAIEVAAQIASALEAAHAAGIVHLDIKTDNIFLTDRGGSADHVKVLDFGISKFLGADIDRTQPVVMGTPEFMSPEQITNPLQVDKRADIYALGVCLYEMLTLRRPFASDDARTLLHRIVHEPPPGLPEQLPAPLRALVMRMLSKEPDERPASMREVIEALDAIGHQLGAPAEAPSLRPPAPRPRRFAKALAAVTLASAAATATYLAWPARGTPAAVAAPVATIAVKPIPPLNILASADAARQRAHALAMTPMLRAAIETDGPTIEDMMRTESLLTVQADEILEIHQHRDAAPVLLVRVPRDAAALSPATDTRLVRTPAGWRVEVGTPILDRSGAPAGILVLARGLAIPRDISPATLARELAAANPPIRVET